MTKPDDSKKVALIKFLFIPLGIFIFYRLLVLAPNIFPYFIGVAVLAGLFFLFGKKLHRTVASKCPKCGGPMNNMGVSKVYRGTLNKDGGANFPSLGKKILRCLDCENEYHELVYYSGSFGDAVDHKSLNDTTLEVMQAVYASEFPKDLKKVGHRSITREEFKQIKQKLAKEVLENNMRAGYADQGIKIDLEDN